MHSPVILALGYLAAMIVLVPIAKRLGLGAILGYLIAGALLGPYALGFISGNDQDVMHLAEFGVVMMLFMIGLELKPALLWQMRGPLLGLGTIQLLVTSTAFFGIARAFGLPWQSAIGVGLMLAMSSTAIVLKTLQDEGALKTDGGQGAFSILLYQDIAVIPILGIFAFLAASLTGESGKPASEMPAWLQTLRFFGAVVGVILAGRRIVRPAFRMVIGSQIHELTTALGLTVVLATSALMTRVGLSPALGAFLAGVVLAESEYRHQLEADLEPFKALLLGIFFISVGSQIQFGLVAQHLLLTVGIVGSLILIKAVVLAWIGRLAKFSKPDTVLLAVALAQGGEFAFVLLSQATQIRLLPEFESQLLMASVALSMACAPLLMKAYFAWGAKRFASASTERAPDVIDKESPIIVAGIGRFGQMITRFLRAAGYSITILDYDAEQVDMLRKFGVKAFYGDASRLDLLRSAGVERAKLLILAIDDKEKTTEIVDLMKQHYPQVQLLVRVYDRLHAYEIINRGISDVFIETAGSALDLGREALVHLGLSRARAMRLAQRFRRHNQESIRELARVYEEADDETYITHAKSWMAALEQTLSSDVRPPGAAPILQVGDTGSIEQDTRDARAEQ